MAQSILGDQFGGVLHTDGYAAYNAVNAKDRKTCLAPLIRKAKEIKQEISLRKPQYQDTASIRFFTYLSALFKKACNFGQKLNSGHISQDHTDVFERRLYSALNSICLGKLADDKAEALRQRLLEPVKEYLRLFTFLKYPDVQPTNNQAEQSLRNMAIFRKICFGTRCQDGSYFHSVLQSLLLTAKRQGKHPLKFFETLFTSDTPTAQAALYGDSS